LIGIVSLFARMYKLHAPEQVTKNFVPHGIYNIYIRLII